MSLICLASIFWSMPAALAIRPAMAAPYAIPIERIAGAELAVICDSASPAAAKAHEIEWTLVIPTPIPASIINALTNHIESRVKVTAIPRIEIDVSANPIAQANFPHQSFQPAVPIEPIVQAIENTVNKYPIHRGLNP